MAARSGEELEIMEILSKSTQTLIQRPEVRAVVHKLLDAKEGEPLTVSVDTDGRQVDLSRVPSTGSAQG